MIAIIDYGAGNIFSVKNALDFIGLESKLTNNEEEIRSADRIILPGVGAFPWAMTKLKESGLIDVIKEESQKKPFLGICLGMQLLFDKGYEFEETEGLSLIKGTVNKMIEPDLSIPHIGWNKLEILNDCPLLSGLSENEYVYFVHSYLIQPDDKSIVCGYADYGVPVRPHRHPAAVLL